MRRAKSPANDRGQLAHLFPNVKCSSIHIEQSYLLSTLSPEAIYADCIQELRLAAFNKIWGHTDGWGILDVLHNFGALCDDPIIETGKRIDCNRVAWKIVGSASRVTDWFTHSTPPEEKE